jgi:hypothetical protein
VKGSKKEISLAMTNLETNFGRAILLIDGIFNPGLSTV